MPKDNGSKNLKILCRPLFFILWFITLSSWEKGSGKKYELVPFVCIFKICPSTDTSWSLHSRYKWPKDTTQNFCSQKLLFPDHFKYEFEHNISIHQFLCHQKLFIMSHWTLISLYYCLKTNQGEHNIESASKINMGSLCNRYLALRLKDSKSWVLSWPNSWFLTSCYTVFRSRWWIKNFYPSQTRHLYDIWFFLTDRLLLPVFMCVI